MWLLLRSTLEYTVGNNLIPFLVQLFPGGEGLGRGELELSRKQDERGEKCFYNVLPPTFFHRDIKRAIFRSDMKCHFKDRKSI